MEKGKPQISKKKLIKFAKYRVNKKRKKLRTDPNKPKQKGKRKQLPASRGSSSAASRSGQDNSNTLISGGLVTFMASPLHFLEKC